MTTDSQPISPAAPAPASASAAAAAVDESRKVRSTIEFPYFDLASSLEIAQGVKQVGGTSCDVKQLGVKLSMSPEGGGFRTRLISAKTFGLVEYERGQVLLTDLGIRAVDPQFERGAKVQAFMEVPLYKALFEKLNGQTLPPMAAIERMAEQLGVAPKQKDKARQAFMRSAKTAGLFELSAERMSLLGQQPDPCRPPRSRIRRVQSGPAVAAVAAVMMESHPCQTGFVSRCPSQANLARS